MYDLYKGLVMNLIIKSTSCAYNSVIAISSHKKIICKAFIYIDIDIHTYTYT